MVNYSARDLVHHAERARAAGIRLRRPGADPLHFVSTSARSGGWDYHQHVSPALDAATCSCPATGACKHGAAAITAARKEATKHAARTMRRSQLWAKEAAAIAA